MNSPYISRVKIKNYRNFIDLDVQLDHKGIIVGENNVGKTNFLKALQLILDPSLSDNDRMLTESDFNETIENPMENNCEIVIQIYIDDFRNNQTVLAALSDASVYVDNKELLLLTYKFFPNINLSGKKEYQYKIFMGEKENSLFGSYQRKYLNLRVIKALRDVENELKNTKTSPVKKLLDDYDISSEDLELISKEYKEVGERVLDLDEIKDITNSVNNHFSRILGNNNYDVSLQAMEVNPSKVIASLKVLMANRSASESSLGLNNILYITMLMQQLNDKTIPTLIKKEEYELLRKKDTQNLLGICYEKNDKQNYLIKENIDDSTRKMLYKFMSDNGGHVQGTTILAIEEPEAHLHPVYQRLIYRDVIKRTTTSVLLTTHSTHITAVSHMKSLVHLHSGDCGTVAHSTAIMPSTPGEFLDVERYLDVKRGEIFLAKGVILVEGIAEEYIVPRFAELLKKPLDEAGIVICNVNCTAFKPYIKLLGYLQIPFVVITDGDFYILRDSNEGVEKVFHKTRKDCLPNVQSGYLGLDNMRKIMLELDIITDHTLDDSSLKSELKKYGVFVGENTFEIDMMSKSANQDLNVFCETYNMILPERTVKHKHFKDKIEKGDFEFCLKRIEDNEVGKGRFAQMFTNNCLEGNCPDYIREAIEYIYGKIV